MKRTTANRRSGIILLVVLSMLTFFSVLAAAYLVFSNQKRQSSFAIATRNIKQPNTNALMNEALMLLIRGTDDGTNPLFGEDLLSDYYGRTDYMSLQVAVTPSPPANGFVRISMQQDPTDYNDVSISANHWDDIYASRIITFTSGLHQNQTYRVLRSISTSPGQHDLIFQLHPGFTAAIAAGDKFRMNGVPRNSPGIGFDGTDVDTTVQTTIPPIPPETNNQPLLQPRNPSQPLDPSTNPGVGFPLPVALQPNHLGKYVDKSRTLDNSQPRGDFDESYDAADFYNWFLSYRTLDPAGNVTVIPSFHRPAVLNYILNEVDFEGNEPSSPSDSVYRSAIASLARATFRPLPLAANQLASGSLARNERFTGGNSEFALRTALPIVHDPIGAQAVDPRAVRLNQLMLALIKGEPDVDNDGDGRADSYWIDFRLPVLTSPEGKLLRPLVAPMIEDLGGRLNVNAHSNFGLVNSAAGLTGANPTGFGNQWAGPPAIPFVFRGLGFGPADINIPAPSPDVLSRLLMSRYQGGAGGDNVPGSPGPDALNVLTSGWRPRTLGANAGYAASVDPFGRGGLGISATGNLVSVNSGIALTDNSATTTITEPDTNEAFDSPYEFDPTGKLGSDQPFTVNEFEAILRSSEFGSELLPGRLRELLLPFAATNPDIAHQVTTISTSSDAPPTNPLTYPSAQPSFPSVLSALAAAINPTLNNNQLKRLIAPELRLGNRLNVNRRFGNGLDDNANGVIDEPIEYFLSGRDDDGDGAVDEADEMSAETEAFGSFAGDPVDANFIGSLPKYDFDEPSSVDARQLLARHLYVLMMTLSSRLSSDNYPSYGDTLTTPVPVSDRNRYRARRLAQWAVNVVDYRDPDSIMTPFEYDENIADGWNPPGNDGLDNDADGLIDEPDETQNVVFGVENPELVFTESLALHDVRVRDTNLDSSGKAKGSNPGDDEDTDQVRVPQGSLFLELYCPRQNVSAELTDPSTAGIPRELYNVNAPASPGMVTYALDLDRTVTTRFDDNGTPADPTDDIYGDASDTAVQTPVWRIAISEPHNERINAGATDDDFDSMQSLRALIPDTLSFQPARLDELGDRPNKMAVDRVVFFTDYASVTDLEQAIAPIPDIGDQAEVFFNQVGANVNLLPEQYLTLAPERKRIWGRRRSPTRASVR